MSQNKIINPLISQSVPEIRNTPMMEEDSLPSDNSKYLASLLGQGAGMFGAALQGNDITRVGQVFESNRDVQNKLNEQKKIRQDSIEQAKLLMDPKSKESERARLIYEQSLKIKIPSNFSASDLKDRDVLQGLIAQSQPKPVLGRGGGMGAVKPQKESLDKNPFNKEIVITSNMARSVDSDLKELIDIIEKSGNSPIFGSDLLRQKQLVGKLAINYNKILDPGSIVKPEEAEAVVKTLGLDWLTRPNVSKDAVLQFKNAVSGEAQNRLQGYYGMYSTFDENEAKVIEKYKENPNDPKLIEAFSNIIKLKRMQGK